MADMKATFTNYGWVSEKNTIIKSYPLHIGIVVISILIAATIFMFKNRKRQVLLCRMNYLLIMVQFALYFFLPDASINALDHKGEITQQPGFFMPLVAAAFIFLAETFIRKDERLVRSADRLR
jgi:uncharacterized membrane protein YkgB